MCNNMCNFQNNGKRLFANGQKLYDSSVRFYFIMSLRISQGPKYPTENKPTLVKLGIGAENTQANIWTNDGLDYLLIHASQGVDKLSKKHHFGHHCFIWIH